jgi:hypothetical protein
MNDPKPGSAETLLRKSSWFAFIIGGALIILASTYESRERETHDRAEYYRREVDEGRLKVSPGLKGVMDENRRNYKSPDYSGTRVVGFLLLIVGLGLSTYSNSLRKKRTGE